MARGHLKWGQVLSSVPARRTRKKRLVPKSTSSISPHVKMARPQLEEVNDDDIDNMDMDIAQFDPNLKTPIAPLNKPVITRSQDSDPAPVQSAPKPYTSSQNTNNGIVDPEKFSEEERKAISELQIIYPCYFDVHRSHKQGRRVSRDLAVENPLATTISDACRSMKLSALLELDKTHPQDFGNPGRVRIQFKKNGSPCGPYTTKRALYNAIAKYLKTRPTTLASVGKNSGVPYPREYEENFQPEEIPKVKGFHMNTIVPVHSSFTMKHPMTKLIYDPEPEVAEAPKLPKAPKKKIMKVRG